MARWIGCPDFWTCDRHPTTPEESEKVCRECRQLNCSHKFIDSTRCLKCGWRPKETLNDHLRDV